MSLFEQVWLAAQAATSCWRGYIEEERVTSFPSMLHSDTRAYTKVASSQLMNNLCGEIVPISFASSEPTLILRLRESAAAPLDLAETGRIVRQTPTRSIEASYGEH
jgi:hypothetical protein